MSRTLHCNSCNKIVANIELGKLIKGLACYCGDCNKKIEQKADLYAGAFASTYNGKDFFSSKRN